MLEAVRISCAGYPTKTLYLDFVDHLWPLAPELLAKEELDDQAISAALLKKTGLQVSTATEPDPTERLSQQREPVLRPPVSREPVSRAPVPKRASRSAPESLLLHPSVSAREPVPSPLRQATQLFTVLPVLQI